MSARRLAAAAVLLLAAACGVPTDETPRQIPADRVPFDLLNPDLESPASPPPSAR
jgi:hypothetical protein